MRACVLFAPDDGHAQRNPDEEGAEHLVECPHLTEEGEMEWKRGRGGEATREREEEREERGGGGEGGECERGVGVL